MELFPILWLAISATSPVLVVLSLWVIYVFHTYRRKWRTVDLFLLSLSCQDLVTALFCFGFAVLRLIGPKFDAPCGFVVWGLTAMRTFQLTTLASAVIDRVLTVRWPYRYRFSVRRNQIRYHIAVLAIIGVLIGVAAVFARSTKAPEECSIHPNFWDARYTIFIVVLYGVLMFGSVIMSVVMEVQRCQLGRKAKLQQMRTATPEYGTSSTGSSVSSSSSKPLHVLGRQTSRRPYNVGVLSESGVPEYRWTVVAVSTLLSFAINHLPYLVLVVLGEFVEAFWTPWHDVAVIWLRLGQGFLFPLVLCLTDRHHWTALKKTLQRRSASANFTGEESRYRLYLDDSKSNIKNLGPVAPIGIITNYKRSSLSYGKVSKKSHRSSWGSGSRRKSLPRTPHKFMVSGIYGVDCILDKPSYLRSHIPHLPTTHAQLQKASQLIRTESCCSADSAVKVPIPAVDYDMDKARLDIPGDWARHDDEDHIYATLSDTLSLHSTVAGDSCATFSAPEDSDEDAESFTTDANDDFEFHDTRPCGGEVRMRSSVSNIADNCYGTVTTALNQDVQAPYLEPSNLTSCSGSYSMNDLDLIENLDLCQEHSGKPARSESLVSLYNPPSESGLSSDTPPMGCYGNDQYSLGQKVMEAIMKNGRSSFVIRRNYVRRAKKRIGLKKHKLMFDCDSVDDGFTAVRRFPPLRQHRVASINAIRRIGSPTSQWHVPVGPDRKLEVISEFI
ncbi:uncharacterized protein LOC135370937 [Ornithodoros turicata]|uniref:uncharacterized protein LOC135370937 n=1 Tax=Ornithodoros turicata TaxID=34597 RepID=UPI0031393574